MGDETKENFTCTVQDRESVVHRSIGVLLYEYIENDADVAQTGTVSSFRVKYYHTMYWQSACCIPEVFAGANFGKFKTIAKVLNTLAVCDIIYMSLKVIRIHVLSMSCRSILAICRQAASPNCVRFSCCSLIASASDASPFCPIGPTSPCDCICCSPFAALAVQPLPNVLDYSLLEIEVRRL